MNKTTRLGLAGLITTLSLTGCKPDNASFKEGSFRQFMGRIESRGTIRKIILEPYTSKYTIDDFLVGIDRNNDGRIDVIYLYLKKGSPLEN